ncbi:GMC family oxidoreductase [Jatrophihabitans cynanchi]|jgi:choline dehydrogenase-like flavoprotein|uniref:GMC family oxidoreductase n=1 Tax=Jatrophihabitans cynanchi TaxID=2944128 RepID=A0ABY7JVC3_9ACTN|nr:GMC family oxidoreductase [Jatrophihabitans sp. SB3-54]WAX56486.1 GMC family oxidoreductase [Jatrophihabitans sp. SB3-54]
MSTRYSYAKVRRRNESAWLLPNDGTRTNHALRRDMRTYADGDEVDLVIVGAGAGGSVLTQRLARAGWRIVCLDAGPFWDPDKDWSSDERGAHVLYWTEPRLIGGSDPVPLGSNNSGRGVGGSMVHYAGYVPRLHPSDFATYTNNGVGADWPISYGELRTSYEDIEAELPVAGQDWPWGDPHSYDHHAHPVGGNGEVFLRGAKALGVQARVGPVAIPNGRFGNRSHCIYRGFCLQGCKVNAKASPLITHVPDALAHGAEIRANCHVSRIHVDPRTNRATGVTYLRDGVEHLQRAKAVVVAGYSIETPRLMLLSATDAHPDGLGNDHDQLGRYLMVQGAPQTAGRFAEEIRMFKAPPPEVTSEQFYEDDPGKPYRRGFSIQNVSPLPITWAEHVSAQGHWGKDLRELMSDYVHWATLGALCEFLPLPQNRVTLAEEKDRHGLPVAHFSYSQCDNDKLLLKAAQGVMEDLLKAAGAEQVMTITRNAHLVGGARMARTAESGVVDSEHRVFGVDRLYVADGSVLPTQGSANPALTIMALAARLADKMIAHGRAA